MPDVNQITQDQTLEQQNPVAPSPTAPVQLQSQPINDAVAPTSSMHYKKHSLPISFKSISLIILFLLVGSVFVISQLSSQKGSLDLRSRAAKKEGNVLKNGSFEQNLLNWKEIKKDKSDRISIITQSPTQGTKAVKLVNVSGKELNLYQDVKVDPDTWYTIRVDGTRSEGSGPAYFEVKEYDLINGNPSFHGDRLTRRSFNKSFQSRGNIVRTGGAKMVTQNTRQFFQRVYAVSGTSCTKEQIDKCGSSGGCNSDWQRCTKNGNKYECIYNSGFCGIYNASFNITPKQESCVANLGGECVLNSQCKLGGFYAIPRGGFSDCRDMGTHGCCAKTSIIETTEKFCSPGGVIKCGKEIPKFEADKCDKTRYGCILNDITGIYRWVEIGEKYSCLDISPKCPNPPVGGTPTPSVPALVEFEAGKSDRLCAGGVAQSVAKPRLKSAVSRRSLKRKFETLYVKTQFPMGLMTKIVSCVSSSDTAPRFSSSHTQYRQPAS